MFFGLISFGMGLDEWHQCGKIVSKLCEKWLLLPKISLYYAKKHKKRVLRFSWLCGGHIKYFKPPHTNLAKKWRCQWDF